MFILKRNEFSLRYIIIIKQYVKYNRIKPEIQFVKGAGSADHSLVCKHSLVSPYSVPLDEESLIYACNGLWDVRYQVLYRVRVTVADVPFEVSPQKEIW
jgi:hypothetical protein